MASADLPTRPAPPGSIPRPARPDEAELYFQRQRQQNPYGRGVAEGEIAPVGPGQPTLRSSNEAVQTPLMPPGFNDDVAGRQAALATEYQPVQELPLTEIIRRFGSASGGQLLMSDVAKELRELANKIEQVTHESSVSSIAWEQVRALCDYLCLRARVIEVERELAEEDAA